MSEDLSSPLDTVADPTFIDPLSEVTRKERRALLSACVVGQAVVIGGLVPEKIEAFGITVSAAQEKSLLYLLAAVLAYFLVGFVVYAWADLRRRDAISEKARAIVKPVLESARENFKAAEQRHKELSTDPGKLFSDSSFLRLALLSDHAKLATRVTAASRTRIIFDVYLPVLIALFSIGLVLNRTRGFPGWKWAALVLVLVLGAGILIYSWRRRKDLRKSWQRRLEKVRDWRRRRIQHKLEQLPEGDPRRPKLQADLKSSVEAMIRDLTKNRP